MEMFGRMAILFGCMSILIGMLAGCSPSQRRTDRSDEHAAATETADMQKGERLFRRHCARCHADHASGAVGPPLRGVTRRYDRDTLRLWIENPMEIYRRRGHMPVRPGYTPMPRIPLRRDEVQAILTYLYARERVMSVE